jgi:hypothetical protein
VNLTVVLSFVVFLDEEMMDVQRLASISGYDANVLVLNSALV